MYTKTRKKYNHLKIKKVKLKNVGLFRWRTDRAAEKKLLVSPVTTLLDP